MMTPPTADQLDRLVGRTLADPAFRQWLFSDPAAAAASLGITLLQDQIDHIYQLKQAHGPALDHLASGMSLLVSLRQDVDRW